MCGHTGIQYRPSNMFLSATWPPCIFGQPGRWFLAYNCLQSWRVGSYVAESVADWNAVDEHGVVQQL